MTGTRVPADPPGNVGRLVLLTTSPRVAPGLLAEEAWSVLRSGRILTRSKDHPQLSYLRQAGVSVETQADPSDAALARRLVKWAQRGTLVWLVNAGDDELLRALGPALEGHPELKVQHLAGSHDLPGARLLDLVALMDRLRSAGGCPWDARQTHESLLTYLVEETYETVEAIESGDLAHLREELGDLLLQVVFHARIAQEHAEDPWSIDDVAGAIVDKLVRRHPHVFARNGDDLVDPEAAEDLETTWERAKSEEKGRTSATDGIPAGLPALSLASKLISRASRTGLDVEMPVDSQSIGARLLALVLEAHIAGVDPEADLRRCVRLLREAIREKEQQ